MFAISTSTHKQHYHIHGLRMKHEKSLDEIGFIMAHDLNQLVSAKAEGNFGSYLLCNTLFLDMFRTLFLREQVGLAFEGSLE